MNALHFLIFTAGKHNLDTHSVALIIQKKGHYERANCEQSKLLH